MTVVDEYLRDISLKIDLIQKNIQKEDIDGIFTEDLLEIQVYIQCLLKLCKHKDKTESSYNNIIVKSFYLLLSKLNENELKTLYGFENLGITFQEFMEKVHNNGFSDLEIKVLIKDLLKTY